MTHRVQFTVGLLAMSLLAPPAGAWLRVEHGDVEVAARSELIVVGRLDKDSIRFVPHESADGHGRSWEHHATLLVSEVLKGAPKDKDTKVRIVIHYGLDPVVEGRHLDGQGKVWRADPSAPGGVDIHDTGADFGPVLANAQNDHIWCLRHLGGELGREPGKGELGVVDPEDMLPLKYKDCILALLAPDMDQRLDRLLGDKDPEIVIRVLKGMSYLYRRDDAPRVARLLASGNEKIQTAAARMMAEVGEDSAIEPFRQALASGNADVRAQACVFLCRFRDVASIPAIVKVARELPALQRTGVLACLPRMQSRELVEALLDQLDEQPGDPRTGTYGHYCCVLAAKGLEALTGVQFPLDSRAGRRIWAELKDCDAGAILRKGMQEDIERVTEAAAHQEACRSLGRLANRDFACEDRFLGEGHPEGPEQIAQAWRTWADKNLLRSRLDWIGEGFASSGIVLPRPMDAGGIDTLMEVLEFTGRPTRESAVKAHPTWKWANGARTNANLLLEWYTGHTVGLEPDGLDLRNFSPNYDGLARRWKDWWGVNRGKVKLLSPPPEAQVTADMIARVPPLRPLVPPLTVTIRCDEKAHPKHRPLAIHWQVKNTSSQDVTILREPSEVGYHYSGGSSGRSNPGHGPRTRDDFVTLKPGQSLAWTLADAPNTAEAAETKPVDALTYTLTYDSAGSELGLRAWRGVLRSNAIDVDVIDVGEGPSSRPAAP